ncbi:unnamed protein product [Cyprideis torosa]|uniref:Acetyl-coenzyme A synthetase n=1 Tax=Cyprideis torosa TaxID=163714 RepID=A0A7R8ZL17_9CRUS|nr:unnamed protein product [Cyprideis torosa]CAG0881429.1 unnamed protein product [Cyprideis torosa]
MRCDMKKGEFSWFGGGSLNATLSCVTRWRWDEIDKPAFIWEKDEPGQQEIVTYKDLQHMMCRVANVLKDHGIQKGDRVAIYMPNSPMAAAAMLACARIGAIHSVVFAGFSSQALAQRINDATAVAVITCDEGVRAGKIIPLKRTVDAALQSCPTVKHVFVTPRTGGNVPMIYPRDVNLYDCMKLVDRKCKPEQMNADDILFLLYTSGSTGQPKGLAHSIAGYLLYASVTHKHVFNYEDDDVYACMADIGWITGHSYVVYGPLCNGATSVIFEGTPTYPNPGRYWETVERLKINQFYTAPTALRMLLKYGDEWVRNYDRSSLKTLGSVGEPLNHEAYEWYRQVVGESRCPVLDTWWQTETGGICIAPYPAEHNAKIIPAAPMRPFFGQEPVILNDQGEELQGNNVEGALCLKLPWPGIARTIYGHHDRYLETYFKPFPGYYFTGDGARRDNEGFIHLTGRMDDIINVSGHRLSTAEVEDALDVHDAIVESAVVGIPHDLKGETLVAFVVLKDDVNIPYDKIEEISKKSVKDAISSYAVPETVFIVEALPKTRSGKIMRRILRKIVVGQYEDFGDLSALAEPAVVESLVKQHQEHVKNAKN